MQIKLMTIIGLGTALVLAGLVVALALANARIDRLEQWEEIVTAAATVATVPPDADGQRQMLDPEQVPAAIEALSRSHKDAIDALREISEDAEEAAIRSRADDAALTATIDEMQARQGEFDPDWDPWGDEQ